MGNASYSDRIFTKNPKVVSGQTFKGKTGRRRLFVFTRCAVDPHIHEQADPPCPSLCPGTAFRTGARRRRLPIIPTLPSVPSSSSSSSSSSFCTAALSIHIVCGNFEILQVKKRHCLRHLYIKCIILPRQARDKHRENSKKSGVSLGRRKALLSVTSR